MTTTGTQRFFRLLPLIVLLWGFLLLRVLNIGAWLAFFVDEMHHMDRARHVLEFSDLQTSTTPGKLLLYYYLAPFGLPANFPGWVGRAAVALFSLVGAAGTYALTRRLFASHRAGLLAVVVLAVFPFMLFHERMVLSDPLAAVFVVLVAWWGVVVAQKPTLTRAAILGVLVVFMLLAKIVAGPLLVLPFMAVALLSPRPIQWRDNLMSQFTRLWQDYQPFILRAAFIILAVWIPIMAFYVGRGLLSPAETDPIVVDYIYAGVSPDYDDSTPQVVQRNLDHIGEMFATLWGLLLIVPTVAGGAYLLWRRPQVALYLLVGIALYWGVLAVVNARPNSRYFTLVGHLWVVLVAGGVWSLWRESSRAGGVWRVAGVLPLVSLTAWVALYGLPFALQMQQNATDLPLPAAEENGYFRNFTGYALTDAIYEVEAQPAISQGEDEPLAYLAVRRCDYVPYHIPSDTDVQFICNRDANGAFTADILEAAARYGALYIIREDFPHFELDHNRLNLTLLERFQRPRDGTWVEVYRVDGAGVAGR